MHGWIFTKNLKISQTGVLREGNLIKKKSYSVYLNLLGKFPGDIIKEFTDEKACFQDGYVENIQELNEEYDSKNWKTTFMKMSVEECFAEKMRGGFCGFSYDSCNNTIHIYSDQVGNKAVYYMMKKEAVIVASNIYFMIKVLKDNAIQYHIDGKAVDYLLSYGYMLDQSTVVTEIKRVLPGEWVTVTPNEIQSKIYYMIHNDYSQELSEREAIERIDGAFRQAVKREFEKDREYGYKHLVDLSGGLDSRMVCWVAHEMGYTKQLNLSYARKNYIDYKVSQKIALELHHMYFFNPLDDANWMMDIEEIVKVNNGAAPYCASTGSNRCLKNINNNLYGIEHTGMVGDAILSTFYKDETVAHGKPVSGLNKYSEILNIQTESKILEKYHNQELFALYTRGLLGAQSSYMIRQEYFETGSPFLDVDFLNVCFKLPYKYRNRHYIYLKWIKEKYPAAAEFGWEKWGGVKPRLNHIFCRKIVTSWRIFKSMLSALSRKPSFDNMNPIDYWYQKDKRVKEYMDSYYNYYRKIEGLDMKNKEKVQIMYENGSVMEKAMALTVLAIARLYFGNTEDE